MSMVSEKSLMSTALASSCIPKFLIVSVGGGE